MLSTAVGLCRQYSFRRFQKFRSCLCSQVAKPGKTGSHFEVLGVPASFRVTSSQLADAHRRLQRKWHPDLHASESDAERDRAAAISARANEAYAVLQNPESRAMHLLALRNVHAESDAFSVSTSLLTWVMQARETVEAADTIEELSEVRQEIDHLLRNCYLAIETAFDNDNLAAAQTETVKLKYLGRVSRAVEARWDQLAPKDSR